MNTIYNIEVNDQTIDVWKSKISKKPWLIQYLKNPTEELCMIAVKADPTALIIIRKQDQTKKICEEAVKALPATIEFVEEQTEDLCVLAIEHGFSSLRRPYIHIPITDRMKEARSVYKVLRSI